MYISGTIDLMVISLIYLGRDTPYCEPFYNQNLFFVLSSTRASSLNLYCADTSFHHDVTFALDFIIFTLLILCLIFVQQPCVMTNDYFHYFIFCCVLLIMIVVLVFAVAPPTLLLQCYSCVMFY